MESRTIESASPASGDAVAARQLFLKYGGSHFQMQRDGEYQRYKAFGISRAQEIQWAEARRNAILSVLEDRLLDGDKLSELVGLVLEIGDMDGLHLLVNLVEARRFHLDTFTALRIAEDLFGICASLRSKNVLPSARYAECRRCIDHLLEIIDLQDFSVDPFYLSIPYLGDVLSQDRVAERVQRLHVSVATS